MRDLLCEPVRDVILEMLLEDDWKPWCCGRNPSKVIPRPGMIEAV